MTTRRYLSPVTRLLVFFLFLFMLQQKLHAAPIAFTQAKFCSATGTSTTCSYTASVAAGDLLVANAVPSNASASAYTIAVSDSRNGAWTRSVECFRAYTAQADFFYLANSAAGTVTVTVTSSTSATLGIAIADYSGIATSSPVDQAGVCSAGAYGVTTITAPALTTTNANDLVLNMLSAIGTSGTVSVSSPYVLRNNASESFADQIVSSAGSYPGATFNWVYANSAFGISAAFKGSSSVVATPSASPAAGTYTSPQSVSLSDTTSGATICYTTDGSTPTATTPGTCSHGTTYSSAINVSTTTTIEAIGTKAGDTNSALLTATYTITGGTATVIICPNNGETGNNANCAQAGDANIPYALAFGKQGTSTSSIALPITINNCSTTKVAGCTGTGSLTLNSTPMTISGPNAGDFSVSYGTCTGSSTITSGSSCQATIIFTPTASAGTNETATLTVADNGTTSTQTLPLSGTSATVTTLSTSACPTALSGNTNYQLTADITCGGTAFTMASTGVDVNLNGHTVTYGNVSQATQISAFEVNGFSVVATIHNGFIVHGAGTNSLNTATTYPVYRPLSSPIGVIGSYNYSNGTSFFNLGITLDYEYANPIDVEGGNIIVHDVNITNTGVGHCSPAGGGPGCRNTLQSAAIYQEQAEGSASGGTKIYNVIQTGGPQGGIMVSDPGAFVAYNFLNPGNATGDNSNNFAIWAWAANENVYNNIINLPITANSDTRGIHIGDTENTHTGGRNVQNNYVGAIGQGNDAEYGGCQLGGMYAIQFDDNPPGTNTAQNNTAVATASTIGCAAIALRVTDSRSLNNVSQNNTYLATRQSGAPACTTSLFSEAKSGCAYGMSFGGPTAFTSTGDTFTADSGIFLFASDGGTGIVVQSPTLIKGSNPSNFHTIVAQNGAPNGGSGGNASIHIIDATLGTGVSMTDTVIGAQSANQGSVSAFWDWTQNMTVTKASGPAAVGALVTFTDALSNTYTCTTNASGQCSVAVTQLRDNNDTVANGVETRTPYSLSVSLSGCTTNNSSGLVINATASRPITLGSC